MLHYRALEPGGGKTFKIYKYTLDPARALLCQKPMFYLTIIRRRRSEYLVYTKTVDSVKRAR